MKYTIPHYYREFRCTASACPDTCCAGWEIMIDEASRRKYRSYPGPFGSRLHNSIDWKEGAFRQYGGRCAFLNEENLCDIYTEAGPGFLCRTCRSYPRHIEEFEGIREISLSLSCIEAAKLILGCREPVRYLSRERKGREESYEDFDFFLFTKLMDARDAMLEILKNRGLDIRLRTGMALSLAHDLQRRIRGGELFAADSLLARYRRPEAAEPFGRKLKTYQSDDRIRFDMMRQMFQCMDELEVLNQDWPDQTARMRDALYGKGWEFYSSRRTEFQKAAGFAGGRKEEWSRYMEQLMVYFVFTYFCGAVYDERAYAKLKFAVAGTLLIQEMCQAVWMEKGSLDFMDVVDIAHRYSREVEHSSSNLDKMETLVMKKPPFRLEKLMCLLAED